MNRYLFKAKRRDDGQWIKGTVVLDMFVIEEIADKLKK